ncbi:MAG TPA: flagellar biosynthesis protein FlhB [Nevskiaceae bacterium]|nr:flagellar biosynthesis protein FlhB [Nevskiaceae bacterium]
MPDSADQSEKTEPATERRRQKAREEGQVARSRELTTFLLLTAGLLGLWAGGAHLGVGITATLRRGLLFSTNQAFDPRAMLAGAGALALHAMLALAPAMLLIVVAALGGPLALGGWTLSGKPIVPDVSRLSPVSGMKRMLSWQFVIEFAKATFKTILVTAVAGAMLYHWRGRLVALDSAVSPTRDVVDGLHMLGLASAAMVMVLIATVLMDVPWQLWHHGKELRMTKDEVRHENRDTEGDPQVKRRIRSLQRAAAKRRMLAKVPTANVVVTNPTHYAVALRYDPEHMDAPRVVAKGAGDLAARIRAVAADCRIPMLEAPPLARALYFHVDIDREIPAALYNAVATVLVWTTRLAASVAVDPPAPADLSVPPGMDPKSVTP